MGQADGTGNAASEGAGYGPCVGDDAGRLRTFEVLRANPHRTRRGLCVFGCARCGRLHARGRPCSAGALAAVILAGTAAGQSDKPWDGGYVDSTVRGLSGLSISMRISVRDPATRQAAPGALPRARRSPGFLLSTVTVRSTPTSCASESTTGSDTGSHEGCTTQQLGTLGHESNARDLRGNAEAIGGSPVAGAAAHVNPEIL